MMLQKQIKHQQHGEITLMGLLVIMGILFCCCFLGLGIGAILGLFFGKDIHNIDKYGTVMGSVGSFLGVVLFSRWYCKMDSIHPPCVCGKSDRKDFELSRAEGFRNVWQCSCGKKYSWPKRQLWFEISDNGGAHLFMKRNYFRWTQPNEKDIADNPPKITYSHQRLS